jgi:fructokinase
MARATATVTSSGDLLAAADACHHVGMITVAGEALVDLVIDPDGAVAAALGGAPFNTARAAARLGAPVSFVGTLSRDRFGTMMADQLAADGVTLGADRTDLPTTLAAAELDASGAASYRFYIAGTSAPALSPDGVHTGSSEILFTGGLGLVLDPMAATIADMVERVPGSTMVIFDINCRPKVIERRDEYVARVDGVLQRTDIVKVSDDDLAYLLPGVEPLDAARRLLDRGACAVLVTAGAEGTSIVTGESSVDIPVPALAAPVVDTIGAGDTFGGGLMAWWVASGLDRDDITEANLISAVRAAHAAAAVVVTRRGADPPRRDELPADWA